MGFYARVRARQSNCPDPDNDYSPIMPSIKSRTRGFGLLAWVVVVVVVVAVLAN